MGAIEELARLRADMHHTLLQGLAWLAKVEQAKQRYSAQGFAAAPSLEAEVGIIAGLAEFERVADGMYARLLEMVTAYRAARELLHVTPSRPPTDESDVRTIEDVISVVLDSDLASDGLRQLLARYAEA